MKASNIFSSSNRQEDQWISVSDLMTGLMIIFLFISISYFRNIQIDRDDIRKIAYTWKETQDLVYESLKNELGDDLKNWNATLKRETLSVSFPEAVAFRKSESSVRPEFQLILNKFFPKFLKVLSNHKDKIIEIRIEGHTSSEWNKYTTELDAYFKNMELSQNRTRKVLKHVLGQPGLYNKHKWSKNLITANGLSSSKAIKYIKNNKVYEDRKRSRRVEFRVVTESKELIQEIIRESKTSEGRGMGFRTKPDDEGNDDSERKEKIFDPLIRIFDPLIRWLQSL